MDALGQIVQNCPKAYPNFFKVFNIFQFFFNSFQQLLKTYLYKISKLPPCAYIPTVIYFRSDGNNEGLGRLGMKRQDKYPETETFHFHNANPKGRLLAADCVARAVSP